MESSVSIPGEATTRLCEAARNATAYVAIGVNERNREASGAGCIVDPRGTVLAGPLQSREEIRYAQVDLELTTKAERMLDVAGIMPAPTYSSSRWIAGLAPRCA